MKRSSADSLGHALGKMAVSLSACMQVNVTEGAPSASAACGSVQPGREEAMTKTVGKLMNLEDRTRNSIRQASKETDEEFERETYF